MGLSDTTAMTGAYPGVSGSGLIVGAGLIGAGDNWQADFNAPISGITPALVLDYSGVEGGQFFDGDFNNKTFADLHTFSRASTATHKDNAGLIVTASSGAHRLDHDKDGNRIGLLIEEAATNETPDSNALDESDWNGLNVTEIDDSGTTTGVISGTEVWKVTGANGDSNAKKYFGSGTSFTATGSSTVTLSAFFKYHSQQWVQLFAGIDNAATNAAWQNFDILNGVLGDTEADVTNAQMEDWGNGWYRCWYVYTTKTTPAATSPIGICMANGASHSKQGSTTSTDSFFIQGAQAEDAVTFPSSYIPTTTVPVTRAAETADVLVSAFAWGGAIGGIMAEAGGTDAALSNAVSYIVGSNDAAVDLIYIQSATKGRIDVGAPILTSGDALSGTWQSTGLKIAASWDATDNKVSVGASAIKTQATTPTVASITNLRIGDGAAASRTLNSHIKTVAVYAPAAIMSDADIVGLATP